MLIYFNSLPLWNEIWNVTNKPIIVEVGRSSSSQICTVVECAAVSGQPWLPPVQSIAIIHQLSGNLHSAAPRESWLPLTILGFACSLRTTSSGCFLWSFALSSTHCAPVYCKLARLHVGWSYQVWGDTESIGWRRTQLAVVESPHFGRNTRGMMWKSVSHISIPHSSSLPWLRSSLPYLRIIHSANVWNSVLAAWLVTQCGS